MNKNSSNIKDLIIGLVIGLAIIGVIVLVVYLSKNDNDNNNIKENESSPQLSINETDHIRGDDNASLTIIEYLDFQCPYCKKFEPTIKKVMEEYKGEVKLIYRHFPLNFHKNAQKSAEASECAGEQDKFWEYADKLFANSQADGTGLDSSDLKRYAQELDLDTDKFDTCLSSNKFAAKVRDDLNSGKELGVRGTPTTFIVNEEGESESITGALPYSQVESKINSMLK